MPPTYKPRQSRGNNHLAVPNLTPTQEQGLRFLWKETQAGRKRHPDPSVWETYGIGKYTTDKHITKATARALEKKGLVTVKVTGSSKSVTIDPFGDNSHGYRTVHWTNASVSLTPAGEAYCKLVFTPSQGAPHATQTL